MGVPTGNSKILIVDDTPDNLTVLRKMLAQQGYSVRPAISGKIALKSIQSDPPDLILLDIIMPEMDGYEVCGRLKSSDRTKDIPVIFISALSDVDSIVRALKAGGVDYITKPFRAQEVLSRVDTHLALRKAVREKEAAHMMLKTILGSIENTIVTVDAKMQVINCNRPDDTLCKAFSQGGFPLEWEQAHGKCPCARVLRQTLETGRPVKEQRITCSCGGLTDKTLVLNTALPAPAADMQANLPANRPVGAVLVIRDITRLTQLEKRLVDRNGFHGIVGKNENMKKIYALLEQTCDLDVNMLICGESGTGKELIAEAIHRESSRADGPLIKANCAALSETLLESELFGHVKGAFTGAVRDREGRFKAAEGGTLFLDEIGDISVTFQAKLLRFLEYKEYERIGDSKTLKADVRVVAATNRDLPESIRENKFRQDLYYRLKGVLIQLPPLRDRRDDILLLTEHFIRMSGKSLGKTIESISEEVRKFFLDYPWPGNIRELKTALHHACALCPGEVIRMAHLPQDMTSDDASSLLRQEPAQETNQAEKKRILEVLEQTDCNKAKSARILGISRATLYSKILKYRIETEDAG